MLSPREACQRFRTVVCFNTLLEASLNTKERWQRYCSDIGADEGVVSEVYSFTRADSHIGPFRRVWLVHVRLLQTLDYPSLFVILFCRVALSNPSFSLDLWVSLHAFYSISTVQRIRTLSIYHSICSLLDKYCDNVFEPDQYYNQLDTVQKTAASWNNTYVMRSWKS